MAKGKRETNGESVLIGGADTVVAPDDGPAFGTVEEGEQLRKRRKRNADAPRPFYLICARHRDTNAVRVLFEETTIGRARRVAPRLANLIERDEIGPCIVRCKLMV